MAEIPNLYRGSVEQDILRREQEAYDRATVAQQDFLLAEQAKVNEYQLRLQQAADAQVAQVAQQEAQTATTTTAEGQPQDVSNMPIENQWVFGFKNWLNREGYNRKGVKWEDASTENRKGMIEDFLNEQFDKGVSQDNIDQVKKIFETKFEKEINRDGRNPLNIIRDPLVGVASSVVNLAGLAVEAVPWIASGMASAVGADETADTLRGVVASIDNVRQSAYEGVDSLRSANAQDSSKQFNEASGFAESFLTVGSNPSMVIDQVVEVIGTGGVGKIALKGVEKVGTTALSYSTKRIAEQSARNIAAKELAKGTDEIAALAMGKEALSKVAVIEKAAEVAQKNAIYRASKAVTDSKIVKFSTDPLTVMALAEGADAAQGVFQTSIATTGTITPDASLSAFLSGAYATGMTATMGKYVGGSSEAMVKRILTGLPSKEATATATSINSFLSDIKLPANKVESLWGLTKRGASFGASVTGKTLIPEMMEEGSIAFVQSVATQGLGADGVWRAENVDIDQALDEAKSASAMAVYVAGLMGVTHQSQHNLAALKRARDEAETAKEATPEADANASQQATPEQQGAEDNIPSASAIIADIDPASLAADILASSAPVVEDAVRGPQGEAFAERDVLRAMANETAMPMAPTNTDALPANNANMRTLQETLAQLTPEQRAVVAEQAEQDTLRKQARLAKRTGVTPPTGIDGLPANDPLMQPTPSKAMPPTGIDGLPANDPLMQVPTPTTPVVSTPTVTAPATVTSNIADYEGKVFTDFVPLDNTDEGAINEPILSELASWYDQQPPEAQMVFMKRATGTLLGNMKTEIAQATKALEDTTGDPTDAKDTISEAKKMGTTYAKLITSELKKKDKPLDKPTNIVTSKRPKLGNDYKAQREAEAVAHANTADARAEGLVTTRIEQRNAVYDVVQARFEEAITDKFGPEIAQDIVYVAPETIPNSANTQAFVLRDDPNTIYVLLHPDMSTDVLLWSVAHERAHLNMSTSVDGVQVFNSPKFNEALDNAYKNPTVKALINAMADTYPNLNQRERTEEALAELYASMNSTSKRDILKDNWGVPTPKAMKKPNSVVGKLVRAFTDFLKDVAKRLFGKKTVSDRDIAKYLRNSEIRRPLTPQAPVTTGRKGEASYGFKAHKERVASLVAKADAIDPAWREHYAKNPDEFLANIAELEKSKGMAQTIERALGKNAKFHKTKGNNRVGPDFGDTLQDPEFIKQYEKFKADGVAADANMADTAYRSSNEAAQAYADAQDAKVRNKLFTDSPDDAKVKEMLSIYYITLPADRTKVSEGREDKGKIVGSIRPTASGDVKVSYVDQQGVQQIQTFSPSKDGSTLEAMEDARNWVKQHTGLWVNSGSWINPETLLLETSEDFKQIDVEALSIDMLPYGLRQLAEKAVEIFPNQKGAILRWLVNAAHWLSATFVNKHYLLDRMEAAYKRMSGDDKGIMNAFKTSLSDANGFLNKNGPDSFFEARTAFEDLIRASNLSREQIDTYFYALEAQIRDTETLAAIMAEKGLPLATPIEELHRLIKAPGTNNPWDGASGFNFDGTPDFAAKRYMAWFKTQPTEIQNSYNGVAAAFQTIVQRANDKIYERGAMTKDDYYYRKHRGWYVTLRDKGSSPAVSPGAHGRITPAYQPAAMTLQLLTRKVEDSYKNEALTDLVRMTLKAPNEWLKVSPYKVDNESVDETSWRYYKPSTSDARSSVVMVDGTPVQLEFTGPAAKALMDKVHQNDIINSIGKSTAMFSMLRTSLAPLFIMKNFMRDSMTAFLNAPGAVKGLIPEGQEGQVARNVMKYAFQLLPDIASGITKGGTFSNPYMEVFDAESMGIQFGSRQGLDYFSRATDRGRPSLRNKIANSVGMPGRTLGRAYKAYSFGPEIMWRAGAFKAYMEVAFPGQEFKTADEIRAVLAANPVIRNTIIQGTKNITVNFEQHGASALPRALYAFWNAAIQGTFVTLPSIMSTKHGRKWTMYMAVAMFTSAMYAIDELGDDEDGKSKFFRIGNRKNKLFLGGETGVEVPQEFLFMNGMAQNFAGMLMGKKDVLSSSSELVWDIVDMASPLALWQTDDVTKNVIGAGVPSIFQGVANIAFEVDFFGRPLRKDVVYDADGKMIKNPMGYESSTNYHSDRYRGLAQFIFETTGGKVDWSGDEIAAVASSVLGSAFVDAMRATKKVEDGAGIWDTISKMVFSPFAPHQDTSAVNRSFNDSLAKISSLLRAKVDDYEANLLSSKQAENYEKLLDAKEILEDALAEAKEIQSPMGYTMKETFELEREARRTGDSALLREVLDDRDELHKLRNVYTGEALRQLKEMGVII